MFGLPAKSFGNIALHLEKKVSVYLTWFLVVTLFFFLLQPCMQHGHLIKADKLSANSNIVMTHDMVPSISFFLFLQLSTGYTCCSFKYTWMF